MLQTVAMLSVRARCELMPPRRYLPMFVSQGLSAHFANKPAISPGSFSREVGKP